MSERGEHAPSLTAFFANGFGDADREATISRLATETVSVKAADLLVLAGFASYTFQSTVAHDGADRGDPVSFEIDAAVAKATVIAMSRAWDTLAALGPGAPRPLDLAASTA